MVVPGFNVGLGSERNKKMKEIYAQIGKVYGIDGISIYHKNHEEDANFDVEVNQEQTHFSSARPSNYQPLRTVKAKPAVPPEYQDDP
jgi:hypothetical protein